MPRKKGSNIYDTSVNVRISQELHDRIVEEARRTEASIGTVVRKAVLEYFERGKINEN